MKDINLPEIQSLDFTEVIKEKLEEARKHYKGEGMIVEDTGYICEALGNLPGPFSKFFLQDLGTERIYTILKTLGNTKATQVTHLGYMNERDEIKFFTAQVQGVFVSPRGEGGFGFDPLFIPDGHTQTCAEMSDEMRFTIKPRVVCAKMLLEHIKNTH